MFNKLQFFMGMALTALVAFIAGYGKARGICFDEAFDEVVLKPFQNEKTESP